MCPAGQAVVLVPSPSRRQVPRVTQVSLMKLNISLNLRVFVRASMRKKRADGEEERDDHNQKHHYTYSELESSSELSFTKDMKTWDADCPGDPGIKRGCGFNPCSGI